MTAPARRERTARRTFVAGALLAAALLTAAAAWWALRPRVPDADAAAALAGAFHAATARLEGNDPADAEARFAAFLSEVEDVPADLGAGAAAVRNRAVAAVLRVDVAAGAAAPEADRPALLPAARAAVAALEAIEPRSPGTWYLESRRAAAAGDRAAEADALREAAALAPGEAWPELALFDLLSATGDPAAAFPSLAKAYEAAPTNVWVLLNFAKAAAAEGDPRTADAFASLEAALAPYAEGFRYRQDGGVPPLIDAGLAAATAGDWPAARRAGTLLLNVMRAEEVARADRLDLERHPLDFVAVDLPSAFYEATELPRTPDAAAVPVTFAPFAGDSAAPETDGVRDAAAENFDLLGGYELVTLTAGAVTVFSRDAGGAWAETLSHPLPEGNRPAGADYTGLALADLDLDSDRAPPAAGGRAAPAVGCHKADVDVLLFGPAGLLLLENRLNDDGSRSLVPVPEQDELNALTGVTAAIAVDLDQEGDLDVLAVGAGGVSLFFNRGNFTFEDRTGRSDVPVPGGFAPAQLIPLDLDRDVDLDVLVGAAGGDGPAAIFENLRHGEFRLAGAPGGPAGVEVLDYDGNASWDVAVADAAGVRLYPSVTPAPGRVAWGEPRPVSDEPADRLAAIDHDNDGRVDLLARGAAGLRLYRNVPGGWADASDRLPELASPPSALAPRDLDGDGDLDILLVAGGKLRLWENRGGEANRSLSVALLAEFDKDGTDPKRCNHAGLGSLLELRRGPVYRPAAVRERVTHFGLGPPVRAAKAGEALRVLWTNGIPEVELDPESGAVCHPQRLGGSCPYLYAWDGGRFAFATDLCWAAPVGLQLAEGVFAPTRAWEHVKLPGELLTPRDGRLELRVTCELWEADYFDRVELTCVDHPAGTEIFTNEKVGPPDLVAPRLYLTDGLHAPAAARARSGGGGWRDVSRTVAVRDEDYCRPFDAKITQGYTEPWELELDLAGAPRSGAVLLLTGWVFPTDTGLNVALSQNPDLAGPRPPQLLMEGADGWAPVLPNAGFPGGKTKTIALPLPDFPTLSGDESSRRVRLAGTQELYWDRAAWCVPGDAQPTSTSAELLSADLRYRGFSARSWPESGHGPDRFDYHDVSTAPVWPAMAGPFTRFGDVRELLIAADDRQAILASGDELALSFAAPPPPPAGWVRDYVVSSVGYDKDANLHTAHGQGALPLPHAGMTRYPPAPDEPFPDAPELREYLRTYQTRPADPRRFWRAIVDSES